MTLKENKVMAYKSVNPYNGKALKTFKELTNKQLEKAIKTAVTCFESWRHATFAERAVVAAKAAAILRARVDEFARPVTNEMGMVFVNHPTWTATDLPFGGIKNSGYGRELSSQGIQEFVNKKLVRVASIDAPA